MPLVITFCLLISGLILGNTVCSSKIASKSWVSIPGMQLSATKSKGIPKGLSSGCLPWISMAKLALQNCWPSALNITSILALEPGAITPLKFLIWYLPMVFYLAFYLLVLLLIILLILVLSFFVLRFLSCLFLPLLLSFY